MAEVLLPQMGKARGPKTPRTHKSAMDTGTRLPDHPSLARDFGWGYERVKDTRQQPQKAKGLSPTGGMELRNFHTPTTQGGGGLGARHGTHLQHPEKQYGVRRSCRAMRRAHPCPHRKRPRCSPGAQLAVCFGSKSAAAGTGSPSSIARAEERPAKQGGRRGTYPAALSARTARSDAAPPSPSVHLHLRHEHGKIALKGDRRGGSGGEGQ